VLALSDTFRKSVLAPDTVSLITVRHSELPYNKLITGTTPSLYLQLDRPSLILEFVQVPILRGHISIAQAEDATVRIKGYRVVDIRDTPPTIELQLNCPYTSNKLTIQLQ
jgi:hypothetical protein